MTRISVDIEQPSVLRKVTDFLTKEDIRAYIVGGYIRDKLLGRLTRDIDIAVAAVAPELGGKLADTLRGKYVLLDEANGIARVILVEGDPEEGIRWHFDFSTFFEGIEADLSRRDFTIDAMAVSVAELGKGQSARLIDPFHGREDLERHLLRVVSSAAFENDPARLIRAVRLAAEYDLTLEGETEALLKKESHLIRQVAGERVRDELCRILAVRNSAHFLLYLDSLGLLTAIVPELDATKGVEQPREHFWDVFHHSIETVAALEGLLYENMEVELVGLAPHLASHVEDFDDEIGAGVTRATLLKIAALLHDIAKPQTKTMESDGRARFLGHTAEGAVVAGDILGRLRFSTREIRMVQKMIEAHLRLWQMGGEEGIPSRRAIYRYFRDTGDVSIDIMFLSLADFLATQGPSLDVAEWQQHSRSVEYVLARREEEETIVSPPKLVDGHDLMKTFDLKPGPRIGEILDAVREAQGAGEINNRDEAMAFAQRHLLQGQTGKKVV